MSRITRLDGNNDSSGGTVSGNKTERAGLECLTRPAGQPASHRERLPVTNMKGFEHRGLVTKVDVGLVTGPDVFETAYDPDGAPYLTKAPNGITKTTTYDAVGVENAIAYKNADGTDLLAFSGTFDSDGRARTLSSPMSNQKYKYDDMDRLTPSISAISMNFGKTIGL